MAAVIKRELSSYFHSPVGFVVLFAFFFFSGVFFQGYCLKADSSSLSYVFSSMHIIVAFLVPLITMKSFSEEKRQKTDQALLTAPVSLFEIVMGKFLSAFALYAMCNAIFIIYALFIAMFTTPDWVVIFTTLLGMLLMGAAFIAINLFISALTESQAVAAIFSIFVNLIIFMLNQLASLINVDASTSVVSQIISQVMSFIKDLLNSISFYNYFSAFNVGIITLSGVVFFVSVTGLFLFLCVRVFEKRRWS